MRHPGDGCRVSWDAVQDLHQTGLIARRDLRRAGVCPRWVSRRIQAEELVVVHPGVLALPDYDRTDLGFRFRAALLQAGPDAALSHTSALAAYGLLEDWDHDVIHVATPGSRTRPCKGVQVHSRPRTPVETVDRLRCVPVKEAIVGSAGLMSLRKLRFPAMQAVFDRLVTAQSLADLRDVPLQARSALRALGEEALAGAESGGEANYYRLVADSNLPIPRLQVWVETPAGSKRVDAFWEELALGCEIDGDRFHGGKVARDEDRIRRNAIQGVAVKLFDFSVDQVMRQSQAVIEDTAANLLARASELKVRPWWL